MPEADLYTFEADKLADDLFPAADLL